MNYADRVRDTTTSTGPTSFTLTGTTVTGDQSFVTAFPSGGAVIPAYIEDTTTGDWIAGSFSLSGSTLTLKRPLKSSNNNQPVTFAAGTKNVCVDLPATVFAENTVNPDDVGFDIILCAGQSNMAGRGTIDTSIDVSDPRVWQFGGYSSNSSYYQKIFIGIDPLNHNDSTTMNGSTPRVGPASWFAKQYLSQLPPHRKVLLVPVSVGGTALTTGNPNWAPGNTGGQYFEDSITQANLAITAAQLLYPNSRFVGTIWIQGESDGDASVSQATYAAALSKLIAGFRSRITGAGSSWFIIGSMVPEAIATRSGTYSQIDAAHQQVASAVALCAFAAGVSGYTSDNLHYTAPGARIAGSKMGSAVRTAIENVAVAPTAQMAVVASGTATTLTIQCTAGFHAAYVPSTSAFAVSGHTVSGVSIGGSTIILTVSSAFTNGEAARTVSYTQPGSNKLRDTYGNLMASFSGLAITNNVANAPGAPTIGVATAGDTTASVPFTAPGSNGGATITLYTATSSPGGITGTLSQAGSGTITVSGLANGTAYTFTVTATNAAGTSAPSSASNSVTPATSATRFGSLSGITESGSGPYDYTGTGGSYNTSMGILNKSRQVGVSGSITATVGTLNSSGAMLTFTSASGSESYDSAAYAFYTWISQSKYQVLLANSPATLQNTVVPAVGDVMRISWSGTTVVFDVSKNSGSTWTPIYTDASLASGVTHCHTQITGTSALTGLASSGLA